MKFNIIINFLMLFLYLSSCFSNEKNEQIKQNKKNEQKSSKVVINSSLKSLKNKKLKKKKIIYKSEPILPEDIYILKRLPNGDVKRKKTTKNNIRVRINQIINSDFPTIKLLISVTSQSGDPVEVANPDVFFLEENNKLVPRVNIDKIIHKKHSDIEIPLSLIVAIDKSGSMAYGNNFKKMKIIDQPLTYAKKAALDFLSQLKVTDDVRVIAFDHDLYDLGKNVSAVSGIKKLKAYGDTALYGALYRSLLFLKGNKGIKAVILLSDGKNDLKRTFSKSFKKIKLWHGLQLADRMSVPVFTIGFGKNHDSKILKTIATKTHSLYFSTYDKKEISNLYSSIKHIINNQYIITYKTTSLSPRTIVKVLIFKDSDIRSYRNSTSILTRSKEFSQRLLSLKKQEEELKKLKLEYQKRLVNIKKRELLLQKKINKIKNNKNEFLKNEKKLQKLNEELLKLSNHFAIKKKEINKAIDLLQLRLKNENNKIKQSLVVFTKRKKIVDKKNKEIKLEAKKLMKKEKLLKEHASKLSIDQRKVSIRELTLEQEKVDLRSKEKMILLFKNSLKKEHSEIQTKLASLKNIRKTLVLNKKSFKTEREKLESFKKELLKLEKQLNQKKKKFLQDQKKVQKLKEWIKKEHEHVSRFKKDLNSFFNETTSKLKTIKKNKLK